MDNPLAQIGWAEPWYAAETPGVQNQLEREISQKHPLHGLGARVVGRRIDNDDVVAVLQDGRYVNVHLVWSPHTCADGTYPGWFCYGTLDEFKKAMRADAEEYQDRNNS
ncbi:hypothetical protein [Noviluteimonas gilva]|uniref:Uncharacterized protein n=1 Tax=Noviluteimonas gilva TaxID=2682097 RepID=A0A7C9HNL3_9GAMM|nr:hypothetical protein [Lysobacter gilvus]MUV15337.1 hypothetical protein [Lysobacter gilvus]